MREGGFTLVELMVVLLVMGLLAGAVVLTAGQVGGGASEAATRYAARLGAARDEAVVTGSPVSAWISATGYGFEKYRGGRWQPLTDKPFEGANWDKGIRVTAGETSGRARVRFDALGLPDAPVTVRLANDDRVANVAVAANGDIRVD